MTNEWRTLEEIYKEVGKFPFEVEIQVGNYNPYVIHGFSKDKHFIAEDRDSATCKRPSDRLAKLYTHPKPKRKIKWHDVVISNRGSGLEPYRQWYGEETLKIHQGVWPNHKITILKTEEVEVEVDE
jgi:hypothetical protein